MWTPRGESWVGGGGVMNWEIGIDIYTLICIKQITNKNLLYKNINKIKFLKKIPFVKTFMNMCKTYFFPHFNVEVFFQSPKLIIKITVHHTIIGIWEMKNIDNPNIPKSYKEQINGYQWRGKWGGEI